MLQPGLELCERRPGIMHLSAWRPERPKQTGVKCAAPFRAVKYVACSYLGFAPVRFIPGYHITGLRPCQKPPLGCLQLLKGEMRPSGRADAQAGDSEIG